MNRAVAIYFAVKHCFKWMHVFHSCDKRWTFSIFHFQTISCNLFCLYFFLFNSDPIKWRGWSHSWIIYIIDVWPFRISCTLQLVLDLCNGNEAKTEVTCFWLTSGHGTRRKSIRFLCNWSFYWIPFGWLVLPSPFQHPAVHIVYTFIYVSKFKYANWTW